jgi:fructokinase
LLPFTALDATGRRLDVLVAARRAVWSPAMTAPATEGFAADDVIVVAGEALFDLVLDPAGGVEAHPGGGPFNTARTIGRLQQPVAFLGRLSTDGFGTRLERMLAADGVRLDTIVHTEDPTMLALAEVDEAGVARYRFYDQGTSAAGLVAQDALRVLPHTAVGMLHVGTLGLMLEPMASALEAVIEALGDRPLVALDPNCRPWAIADPDAYRRRLRRVLARADLVKVSEEDVAWLDPDLAPVAAARALLQHGPRAVLLTRGGAGAVVVTAAGETAVPVPPVVIADTIGAGDAFGGGFLAWWRAQGLSREALADHERVVEATRFACLVAAKTCERPGASPPRLEELRLGGAGGPAPGD